MKTAIYMCLLSVQDARILSTRSS